MPTWTGFTQERSFFFLFSFCQHQAPLLAAVTTIVGISRYARVVSIKLHGLIVLMIIYRQGRILYLSEAGMMRYMEKHDLCLGQPPNSVAVWFKLHRTDRSCRASTPTSKIIMISVTRYDKCIIESNLKQQSVSWRIKKKIELFQVSLLGTIHSA